MPSLRTSGITDSAARSAGDSGAQPDPKLAAAIDTIVRNCGEAARRVLFDAQHPQTRQAILQLSRTADTRQRYRVRGVLDGRFRSVAPQNDDPVYDTVAFREVPSRLARARGAIQVLERSLKLYVEPSVRDECRRLVELCRRSAIQQKRFVAANSSKSPFVPKSLSRKVVWPILKAREVRGHTVGQARLALALTIKSVWDFPEMRKRGITATERERPCTRRELETINAACAAILNARHAPSRRTRGQSNSARIL